jgi:hypothetical protein
MKEFPKASAAFAIVDATIHVLVRDATTFGGDGQIIKYNSKSPGKSPYSLTLGFYPEKQLRSAQIQAKVEEIAVTPA